MLTEGRSDRQTPTSGVVSHSFPDPETLGRVPNREVGVSVAKSATTTGRGADTSVYSSFSNSPETDFGRQVGEVVHPYLSLRTSSIH